MTDSKDFNKSDQQASSHDCSTQDTCCICLGDIENRSTTNACRHSFCFSCIVQWSEITASCPMCRTTFSEIRHDIKDDGSYSSKKVQTQDIRDWVAPGLFLALASYLEVRFPEFAARLRREVELHRIERQRSIENGPVVEQIEMNIGNESASNDDGPEVPGADIAEGENERETQRPIENVPIVEQAEMNLENESASSDDGPEVPGADIAEGENEINLGNESVSVLFGDDHTNVPSQASSTSQERLNSSAVTTATKKRPGRDCEDESDNDSDDEDQRPPLKRFKC